MLQRLQAKLVRVNNTDIYEMNLHCTRRRCLDGLCFEDATCQSDHGIILYWVLCPTSHVKLNVDIRPCMPISSAIRLINSCCSVYPNGANFSYKLYIPRCSHTFFFVFRLLPNFATRESRLIIEEFGYVTSFKATHLSRFIRILETLRC